MMEKCGRVIQKPLKNFLQIFSMEQKHIHFIGICGVAMGALAIAFQKKGWRVTGSDKGFYPPISTYLKNAGIEYYPGWHVEKMTANGNPDLVVVGNVAGSTNPEWVYVQENKLHYKSYPEVIGEFFCKEHTIVCAGTYGKTTTSALLSWIFSQAGLEPNYMFGGLTQNEFPAAQMSESQWSILEGDEYKSARFDTRAKFEHYKPLYLLLTSVEWDHADVYDTFEKYTAAFQALAASIPDSGMIVVNTDNQNALHIGAAVSGPLVVTYGSDPDAIFRYENVAQTKDGISFDIVHTSTTYHIETPLLGLFNVQNITGVFAMAHELSIEPEKIIQAIKTFPGLKRRLEKRLPTPVTIIDDIAHSPVKAASVLKEVRSIYTKNIFAVFEPNTGNRMPSAMSSYAHAFDNVDTVYIPRLTTLKQDAQAQEQPVDGAELARTIQATNTCTVVYIENDDELVNELHTKAQQDDVIIFLGSHGFRGMIESLLEKYKK